jgi:hypothetical protein
MRVILLLGLATASTGGTGTGTTGGGTETASTGAASTGTAGTGGTSTTGTGTAGTSGSGTSLDSTAAHGTTTTGACLSAPYDGSVTDTETEPELLPCLCACESGDDRDAARWAPALLLPVVARRRRSRRRSLERIAAAGRLPDDVVARLRRRLDAGD